MGTRLRLEISRLLTCYRHNLLRAIELSTSWAPPCSDIKIWYIESNVEEIGLNQKSSVLGKLLISNTTAMELERNHRINVVELESKKSIWNRIRKELVLNVTSMEAGIKN